MWKEIITAVVVCFVGSLMYFVNDVVQKRKELQNSGLPQPPMQNLLVGHLHLADECRRLFPKDIHSHAWPDYIREKWKLPEVFYVDWRPFGPLWLHMANGELANEYITTKQCLPKSPWETSYVEKFLGKNSMVSLEGHRWKTLRSMFNPGFSAGNVMTYVDGIVVASLRFADVLKEKAKTNELFRLEDFATRLTIDIIGLAVLDVDMQAQTKLHPIVQHFRERVVYMPGADSIFPWQDLMLSRPFKLWWNNRKLEAAINKELDNKVLRRAKDLKDEADQRIGGPKKRSIVDLALNAYEKEVSMGENVTTDRIKHILEPQALPASLRADIVDQIKTFIFAGHDTTSSTICWTYYLLHRNPRVQEKLEAELNHFFPRGTSAAETIRQDPYIINKLEYTTAVIKETLRIFPPASTIRYVSENQTTAHTTFKDSSTQQEYFLEGATIWPATWLLHRNRRFFPKPTHFIPERFISSQTPFPDAELFTPAGKSAFQAFAIGPRNCIGQELAMIELRVIVALTAREVDFVLEYPGEDPDPQPPIPESTAAEFDESTEYGKKIRNGTIKPNVVEGHRVWQTLSGSAKPNGRCPGRVYLRG